MSGSDDREKPAGMRNLPFRRGIVFARLFRPRPYGPRSICVVGAGLLVLALVLALVLVLVLVLDHSNAPPM